LCLTIEPRSESELWIRRFGGKTLATIQRLGPPGCVYEQFGLLEFTFELQLAGRTLKHVQRAVALKILHCKIPMPLFLAPHVRGQEHASADDTEVQVAVEVHLPFLGLLLAYNGTIQD